jgi:PAS domain-containing protein
MFDLRNIRAIFSTSDAPDETQTMDRLRDRIANLEEENARHRRLEETIQRNARLFDAILQKCNEGILLISPDLIVLRLVHSSAGYQEVEVVGQSALSVIHPDDAGYFQASISQLLSAQAECACCEFRLKTAQGWTWMSCEMTDMLDDPDVQAILLNARIAHKVPD